MVAAAAAEQAVEPAVPVALAPREAPVVGVEDIAGVFHGLHIRLIPERTENMVYRVITASQGPEEQMAAREKAAPPVSMAEAVVAAVPVGPVGPEEGTIITVAMVIRDPEDPLSAAEETATAVIMHSQPVTATEGQRDRPELMGSRG